MQTHEGGYPSLLLCWRIYASGYWSALCSGGCTHTKLALVLCFGRDLQVTCDCPIVSSQAPQCGENALMHVLSCLFVCCFVRVSHHTVWHTFPCKLTLSIHALYQRMQIMHYACKTCAFSIAQPSSGPVMPHSLRQNTCHETCHVERHHDHHQAEQL